MSNFQFFRETFSFILIFSAFWCAFGDGSVCMSSLTQKDCAGKGYLVPDASDNCPGCVTGEPFHETCNTTLKCAPGLKCEDNKCILNRTSCIHTYQFDVCPQLRLIPTCDVDGTYSAVQCKGDRITGRCFCHSETGKRIFGWGWRTEESIMTCACSRRRNNLEANGMPENTLHCDQYGNYEPLQCNDGVCWCADKKTGDVIPGTRAVPQSMWKFLPCYDSKTMGEEYLRQCESAAYAQFMLKKSFEKHGTTKVEFLKIHCDYDGAYGILKITDGLASCQWRDGKNIGSYQVSTSQLLQVDCNCARDQKIFGEMGYRHILSCKDSGNYKEDQDVNGKKFCVDKDGFALTEPEDTLTLSCDKYMWDKVEPNDCKNGAIAEGGTDASKTHVLNNEGSGDYY